MVNGEVVKFKYPEDVAYHYISRGAVDNHNSLRHDGRKKPQFFSFLIACTEVNVYLAMKYFLKTDDTFTNFRIFWLRR